MIAEFALTSKQVEALEYLSAPATHCMLFGGSRSGKTFLIMRSIVLRALKAAGSLHLAVRLRQIQATESLAMRTFDSVMRLCFPGVDYVLSRKHWFARFHNGAEVWFGGLDDGPRMEKLLGQEYATIWPNECSQIGFPGIQLLRTRLAQKVTQTVIDPYTQLPRSVPLKNRMWYDENPPTKAHWSSREFIQKVEPDTLDNLKNPANYVSLKMNPEDNLANINDEYMSLLDSMSGRMRRRFRDGEFADATENALFEEAHIDAWRVEDGVIPDMVRVVTAVDPSGAGDSDNADNDAIGICTVGLGTDGNAYVLEDSTVKAGPATWGAVAIGAYQRHRGDCVVGETNFGGDMVRQTIQVAAMAAGVRVSFKKVTASRGKVQRAEPFAAMYETGKVRHVGMFVKLEEELCAFSTSGYTGPDSPNRADALIWALAELFPALVAPPKAEKKPRDRATSMAGPRGWMG